MIRSAAEDDKRSDFDTEMDTYTFWAALTTGQQDAFWASARKLWS